MHRALVVRQPPLVQVFNFSCIHVLGHRRIAETLKKEHGAAQHRADVVLLLEPEDPQRGPKLPEDVEIATQPWSRQHDGQRAYGWRWGGVMGASCVLMGARVGRSVVCASASVRGG